MQHLSFLPQFIKLTVVTAIFAGAFSGVSGAQETPASTKPDPVADSASVPATASSGSTPDSQIVNPARKPDAQGTSKDRLFFLLPKTGTWVVVFAAVMGLTWLGTVPLTSGLIAKLFGTRHLGTLFGVCFLSHQLGSFLGAWLGGYVFDVTGSYSLIWGATALAGLLAAMLHFPIDDTAARGPLAEAGAVGA